MKKHFLNSTLMQGLSLGLLFLFASVTAYAQRYSYESIPNDPMQTRIYTLKNGLKNLSFCQQRETSCTDIYRCAHGFSQ